MKIYLDSCCYGRPFDDRTQQVIEAEAIAVLTAVDMCRIVGYGIVGSDAATFEIGRISDAKTRADVMTFYNNTITETITITSKDVPRAREYQTMEGMGAMDSLHLVTAEVAGANFLLTTDKDFLKKAVRLNSPVKVINPINFKL